MTKRIVASIFLTAAIVIQIDAYAGGEATHVETLKIEIKVLESRHNQIKHELITLYNDIHHRTPQSVLDSLSKERDGTEAIIRAKKAELLSIEPPQMTHETEQEIRTLYPDLLNRDSALYKAMWKRYNEYQSTNPQFFDYPQWPKMLAKECAVGLGIKANN